MFIEVFDIDSQEAVILNANRIIAIHEEHQYSDSVSGCEIVLDLIHRTETYSVINTLEEIKEKLGVEDECK